MYIRRVEQGFTITELLIGLLMSMLVMAGVVSVYLTTLTTSGSTIKSSRLNQEMGAIMNIMVNDIRRAGYWGDVDLQAPESNPFNLIDGTINSSALRVHSTPDNGATYVDNSEAVDLNDRTGSCITYTYDVRKDEDGDGTISDTETGDGVLDNDERFGFRWNGLATDALVMRMSTSTGPNNCISSTTNQWSQVTDPNSIVITNLEFNLSNSKCMNNSEPDGVDEDGDGTVDEFAEYDCYLDEDGDGVLEYAPDPDERTTESLDVTITLEAQLADDPSVKSKIIQSVKVRNYLVRVR